MGQLIASGGLSISGLEWVNGTAYLPLQFANNVRAVYSSANPLVDSWQEVGSYTWVLANNTADAGKILADGDNNIYWALLQGTLSVDNLQIRHVVIHKNGANPITLGPWDYSGGESAHVALYGSAIYVHHYASPERIMGTDYYRTVYTKLSLSSWGTILVNAAQIGTTSQSGQQSFFTLRNMYLVGSYLFFHVSPSSSKYVSRNAASSDAVVEDYTTAPGVITTLSGWGNEAIVISSTEFWIFWLDTFNYRKLTRFSMTTGSISENSNNNVSNLNLQLSYAHYLIYVPLKGTRNVLQFWTDSNVSVSTFNTANSAWSTYSVLVYFADFSYNTKAFYYRPVGNGFKLACVYINTDVYYEEFSWSVSDSVVPRFPRPALNF